MIVSNSRFITILLLVGALIFVPVLNTDANQIDLQLPENVKLGDCWAKKFHDFFEHLAQVATEVSGPLMERYARCKPILSRALKESVDRITPNEMEFTMMWVDQFEFEDDEDDEPIVWLLANQVTDLARKKVINYRDRVKFDDLFELVMANIRAPFAGVLMDQVDLYELLLQCSVHDEDFEQKFVRHVDPDPLTLKWIPIAKLFKDIDELDREMLNDRVYQYLTKGRRVMSKGKSMRQRAKKRFSAFKQLLSKGR